MIDEYHHLKCKRKRLSEGRHDELPPAGALRDTLGASSSLCRFLLCLSSFLLHCSSVHPSSLLSFYASLPLPSSSFFYNFLDSLSTSHAIFSTSLFLPPFSSCALLLSLSCPHDFHFCPPSFIQVYLTHFGCVTHGPL